MNTELKHKIENKLCLWSNNSKTSSIKGKIADTLLAWFFGYKKNKKMTYFSCNPYMPNNWQHTNATLWKKCCIKFIEFLASREKNIVTMNVDSFMFKVKRFTNFTTEKKWWLINLYYWTICTNNRGE